MRNGLQMKMNGFGGHFSMSMKLAVGLTPKSIRRELHSKRDTDISTIMGRKIFEQDQIQRAAELGFGIRGPQQIQLVAGDEAGRTYADKMRAILKEG